MMSYAILSLCTLVFVAALLLVARLHILSEAVKALVEHLDSDPSGAELRFLRTQVERLQEQLLAVAVPAAQARLHLQSLPPAEQARAVLREATPPAVRRMNPMQIDVPEGWQAPSALGPIEDDGVEAH